MLGPARNRVDGPLKVTGHAKYAVEFEVPRCVHAWPVVSNMAKATITAMETKAAESAPGVLKVLTHQNAPQPKEAQAKKSEATRAHGIRIEERNPLSDDQVHYAGQYVALVVAKTIEQAQYAASLVRVNYAPEEPLLSMAAAQKAEKPRKNQDEEAQPKKGDVAPALANPDIVRVHQTYTTPTETHNPIEMSGTIAAWEGDRPSS